ncbi:MAG: hypothetical protein IJC50_00580 [Clostridia bacterium]|nr:hypothetical protein [Clostridia bacterium]
MKKLVTLILCVILCAMMIVPVSVSAASWYIKDNPVIVIPNATPNLDGHIAADEGWSAVGHLNEDTAAAFYGVNPLTSSVDFYFASTDEGLYIAADLSEVGAAYTVKFYDADGNGTHIATYADPNAQSYTYEPGGYPEVAPDGTPINFYKIDDQTTSAPAGVIPDACFWYTFGGNSFQYSTGEDDIDGYAGWNGDVISFMIDPCGAFEYDGFMANEDYTPYYNFGMFEDGSVKVYRSRITGAEGDITIECKTAGKVTDDGFCFEAMIPWEVIVDDANNAGAVMGLSEEITKENCLAEGTIHRAAFSLQDRFYDDEAGAVDTWGRYMTVPSVTADGVEGFKTSGGNIKTYGLKLQMGGEYKPTPGPDPVDSDSTPADSDTNNDTPSDSNTTGSSDSAKPGETTKKDDVTTKKPTGTTKAPTTNKNTTSTNKDTATQTFDAGIAVAIGALATSALGVVYSKKRK